MSGAGTNCVQSSSGVLHSRALLPTKQYFARLVRVEYDLDNFGARLSKGPFYSIQKEHWKNDEPKPD